MKYLLYFLLALLALSLLAGVTTFFFTKTEGVVLATSKSEVRGAAYPAQKGGAHGYDGGKKTILNVQYEYVVEEQRLSSSLVAFRLIDIPRETLWVGQKVDVFYFPFYPKVAVLQIGPDKWLLFSAIAVLLGWLLLRSILTRNIEDV